MASKRPIDATKLKRENVVLYRIRTRVRDWSGRTFLNGFTDTSLAELDKITDEHVDLTETERVLDQHAADRIRQLAYRLHIFDDEKDAEIKRQLDVWAHKLEKGEL
ncbi:hypothetical protein [Gryllotalpicola koreensis]|uniref:Uncharacterized protein n=1 Tax=Gryllotalpicola koreensis TaxID=993086 RepID=A0ABP8A2U1_9MICO